MTDKLPWEEAAAQAASPPIRPKATPNAQTQTPNTPAAVPLAAGESPPWLEAQKASLRLPEPPKAKKVPWEIAQQKVPYKGTLDEGWDAINKKSIEGQASRNKVQLEILQTELSKETNPANIASLKREIKRAEDTIKGNKNG